VSDVQFNGPDELFDLTRSFISRVMDFYLRLLAQKRNRVAALVFRATLLAMASLNGMRTKSVETERASRSVSAALLHRVALLILLATEGADEPDEQQNLDAFDAAADLCGALWASERGTTAGATVRSEQLPQPLRDVRR
jgi:hypothetical protein